MPQADTFIIRLGIEYKDRIEYIKEDLLSKRIGSGKTTSGAVKYLIDQEMTKHLK